MVLLIQLLLFVVKSVLMFLLVLEKMKQVRVPNLATVPKRAMFGVLVVMLVQRITIPVPPM
jgi:hypothetical protein